MGATLDEGRARLAEVVRQRRLDLGGLTQREAATKCRVSETRWVDVEGGRPVGDRTLAKVEHGLGFPRGYFDAILAGDPVEPVELQPSDTSPEIEELVAHMRPEDRPAIRALQAELAELRRETERRLRQLEDRAG